jgi:hypothetical protein
MMFVTFEIPKDSLGRKSIQIGRRGLRPLVQAGILAVNRAQERDYSFIYAI